MSSNSPSPWRGRMTMIVVVLLFAVPPVIAWFMLTSGWGPASTVNHGELVRPPERLSTSGWMEPPEERYFAGRWTLLHVSAGACDGACADLLDKTARVRLALDKDAARVQRLVLLVESAPALSDGQARGARVVRAGPDAIGRLLDQGQQLGLSLVDPQGYRMMRYPMPLDGSDLLEDLERVLRLSDEDIERYQRREADDHS